MQMIIIDGVTYELSRVESKPVKEAPKFWEPVAGKDAWYIDAEGIVMDIDNWDINDNRISQGNVFKNGEEAHMESKRRAARYRLKKRIWELNGGEFPQWGWEYGDVKWFVSLHHNILHVHNREVAKYFPSWWYLKTEESANHLLEEMRDDLMLVLSE
jgi:hypothetical protein